jgi:predicted nucleic acid-binding protein
MNRIFIDTVFVVALASLKDQYHPQAMALSKKY